MIPLILPSVRRLQYPFPFFFRGGLVLALLLCAAMLRAQDSGEDSTLPPSRPEPPTLSDQAPAPRTERATPPEPADNAPPSDQDAAPPGDPALKDALDDMNRRYAEWYANYRGRAPYPYYRDPFGIDTNDRAVGRSAWFDLEQNFWFPRDGRKGVETNHRAFNGPAQYSWNVTHLRDQGRGDAVQWFRGAFLGRGIPLIMGYGEFALGGGWLDDHASFHGQFSLDMKTSVTVYPIWPLGFDIGATWSFFEHGNRVIDWHAHAKLQLFRPIFLQAGWREIDTFGRSGGLEADGWYVGISLTFSNLLWAFHPPSQGTADGLFSLLTGNAPLGRSTRQQARETPREP